MSAEENLISTSSLTEKNRELMRSLDAAMEVIQNYEALIAQLKNDNNGNMRKLLHDLASPLQILMMTIESLQDRAPEELTPSIERIKRSIDAMIELITAARKLNSSISAAKSDIKIV